MLSPSQAVKMMREYTKLGVPFSFSFVKYSKSRNTTDGVKVVEKAVLRQGLRNNQSDLSQSLVAYTDLSKNDSPRFFHLSLLLTINDIKIEP